MKEIKFSVGIWAFTSCADRFVTEGYRKSLSLTEQIKLASQIEGLDGLILQFPAVVNRENAEEAKRLLQEGKLKVSAVDAHLFGSQFSMGAFTSGNERTRRKAIEIAIGAVDMAEQLDCSYAGLWLGQDGFDYPFQANYSDLWDREIEAIREVAAHNPEVKICIEYKLKEPRMHLTIGSVGKALLICEKIAKDNVGVTLDFGHAMLGKENPAESATLLAKYNRLFSIHFNDCYRETDDDLIAGSVHSWELLELLLVLQQVEYKGWYGLDIFPYREDIVKACEYSIQNIKSLLKGLEKIDIPSLVEAQKTMNYIRIHRIMRGVFYPLAD
jgi:xylose isomerase